MRQYLEEAVQVVAVDGVSVREGLSHVLQGSLAVALQVRHDAGRVVPPQQVHHLQHVVWHCAYSVMLLILVLSTRIKLLVQVLLKTVWGRYSCEASQQCVALSCHPM